MRYAIYMDQTTGSIKYGKIHEAPEVEILQRFHTFKSCSSLFHNYMAMVGEIDAALKRAERIGADTEMLAGLSEAVRLPRPGDVVDQTIPLAAAAFQILCELEKAAGLRDHEGKWRDQRFAKMIDRAREMLKADEPAAGSVSAMSDGERETLRQRLLARGMTPKF